LSDNARNLYDRVLFNNIPSLEAISCALQFSMINFVTSVTGELTLLQLISLARI